MVSVPFNLEWVKFGVLIPRIPEMSQKGYSQGVKIQGWQNMTHLNLLHAKKPDRIKTKTAQDENRDFLLFLKSCLLSFYSCEP